VSVDFVAILPQQYEVSIYHSRRKSVHYFSALLLSRAQQNLVERTARVRRSFACRGIALPHPCQWAPLRRVRWFGNAIIDFDCASKSSKPSSIGEEFARQALLLGAEGQTALRTSTVAIAGAGGGGSHVIQQLLYAGVGRIIVIDPDVYENSNRHRLVSAEQKDLGRPKVDIFHRLARKIGLGGRIQSVRAAIPDGQAIQALLKADVVVGCVDTLFTRADLQEIASRYLIPYVDIGATIRPVPDAADGDPRVVVSGNVLSFIPGSFCMWCSGFLSDEKLKQEQNGPTRGYFEKNNQEAQVVSFNGVVASQAVSEVLQLLTGFRGAGLLQADLQLSRTGVFRGYKKFDGVAGTLTEWGGARRVDCPHCKDTLAAGDIILSPVSQTHAA
jgi:ThiF family